MGRLASTLVIFALVLALAGFAHAGQQGGSIVYRDFDARSLDLEFRAWVWPAAGGYSRAAVEYREVGSPAWRPLDRNWCWTRRCALEEMVSQARYIGRDGYIWRFQQPRPMNWRPRSIRFDEACYRESIRFCTHQLLDRFADEPSRG